MSTRSSWRFSLNARPPENTAYVSSRESVRQRRQASEALARLRDGAFAAAGLDYSNDLASWLGPETGHSPRSGCALSKLVVRWDRNSVG